MNIQKDLIVANKNNRPFLLDAYYEASQNPKPFVIFVHGIKGFKDWGHWHLIPQAFAKAGFVFIKFNFSHNGTTLEHPLEFADLEAFGNNNYSKELDDLDAVLNWLEKQEKIPQQELNLEQVSLIGHSRGGGIGIIKAVEEARIKCLITWAAVHSLAYAWADPEKVNAWKEQGVYYLINGRTKQQMPTYYQFYEDFIQNKDRLDIQLQLQTFRKPFLIVHGTADPAVPEFAARQLEKWAPSANCHLIEGADHVFGATHPFQAASLPKHSEELVAQSIAFLKRHC